MQVCMDVGVSLLGFKYFGCQTFLILFIFHSPFSVFFLYLLLCEEFLLIFRWLAFFWLFLFLFLLLSFVSRIVVNECLKNTVRNCFSFALLFCLVFRIIGKTIKRLGFHNNKHLLHLSSLDVSSRGVFRTLSNI